MSDAIITVTNLGKKYRIKHQGERQRYVALRDKALPRSNELLCECNQAFSGHNGISRPRNRSLRHRNEAMWWTEVGERRSVVGGRWSGFKFRVSGLKSQHFRFPRPVKSLLGLWNLRGL